MSSDTLLKKNHRGRIKYIPRNNWCGGQFSEFYNIESNDIATGVMMTIEKPWSNIKVY
jgi:hypothetical protein